MSLTTGLVRFEHAHEEWIPMPAGTTFVQNRSEREIDLFITEDTTVPTAQIEGIRLEHLEKFPWISQGANVYIKAQYKKSISVVVITENAWCGSGSGGTGGDVVDNPDDVADVTAYFNGVQYV